MGKNIIYGYFDLFSKRHKNKVVEIPDVYQYEDINDNFTCSRSLYIYY